MLPVVHKTGILKHDLYSFYLESFIRPLDSNTLDIRHEGVGDWVSISEVKNIKEKINKSICKVLSKGIPFYCIIKNNENNEKKITKFGLKKQAQ